ncbi:MAG: DUF4836 family protein [Sediminibacterium sp.]|jgi:hypothetical protein|nr:DUF4836 family protein [Sediminibacterium sp.]
MKKSSAFWLIPVWLVFMTACSNKSLKEAAYIPKDAALVAVLDVKEMKAKLKKNRLNIDSIINSLINRNYASPKIIITDSAIITETITVHQAADLNIDKMILFVQSKTLADNSTTFSINILTNKNRGEDAVSDSISKSIMKDFKVEEEKSFSTAYSPKMKFRMSWNDDITLATYFFHEVKPVYDTLEMTFKMPAEPNIESESKAEVAAFFNQSLDQSLASVEQFTDMFSEKADGYLFTSSNSSVEALKKTPFNLPKLEELLKDNYTAATLHFEQGKVRIQSTNYFNPTLSSLLRQYAGPVVNWSLVNDYPEGEINMLALASFQPALIGGILQHLELKSFADNFLNKSGLTLDEAFKAIKGEIAVVASDLSVQEPDPMKRKDELTLQRGLPGGKLLVRLPVGEKASYLKLMETGVKNGWLVKKGTTYSSAPEFSALGTFLIADEQNIYITSDSSVYNNYLAAAGKKNKFLNSTQFQSYNAASTLFYVNIASTIRGLTKADDSYTFHQATSIIASTIKEMTISSDNFDGKSVHNNLEVTMQDAKTNSLVSLTKMMSALEKEFNWLTTDDRIPFVIPEDSTRKN